MDETIEQGLAARPFKEQFPELSDDVAKKMDYYNQALIHLLMADLLTMSQVQAIRDKRFPRLVVRQVTKAREALNEQV